MGPKKKIKIGSENQPEQTAGEAEKTTETPQFETPEQEASKFSSSNAETPADDMDRVESEGENDTPGESVHEMEAKIEAAANEAKESYDRFLRVSAEFENYKKRTTRQVEEFKKYANQALIKDLLPVVDNLELALKSSTQSQGHPSGLVDGVDLTLKEVLKVFEKYHITPIDALGKPFDPKFHEAVMREESEEYTENTVINEMQRGYLIHDRLLRPTMVVVAMPKTTRGDNRHNNETE